MRVQLESPLRGNNYEQEEINKIYLDLCIADSLNRGEFPFASHKQYIGATDDRIPAQRALGIEAGLEFLKVAQKSVIYTDFGVSSGMAQGIKRAVELGIPLEFRTLPKEVVEKLVKENTPSHDKNVFSDEVLKSLLSDCNSNNNQLNNDILIGYGVYSSNYFNMAKQLNEVDYFSKNNFL